MLEDMGRKRDGGRCWDYDQWHQWHHWHQWPKTKVASAVSLPLCVSLFHRLVLDGSPHNLRWMWSDTVLNFSVLQPLWIIFNFFREGAVVFEWSPTSSSPQARSLFPSGTLEKSVKLRNGGPLYQIQPRRLLYLNNHWMTSNQKNPTSRKSSASVFSSLRPSSLMCNLVENKTGEKNTIFLRWEQQRPRILFIWAKNQVSNHDATVSVH